MAERELAGPRYRRMRPGGPADRWEAAGTSSHYVILDGDAAGAVEVEVEGPPEAELQVTALPLGEDRARLTLSSRAGRGPGGERTVLARVAERHGVPVRLSALSWEPMVPGTRPRSMAIKSGGSTCWGSPRHSAPRHSPQRGELQSGPIRLRGPAPSPARWSSRSSAPTRRAVASRPGPNSMPPALVPADDHRIRTPGHTTLAR